MGLYYICFSFGSDNGSWGQSMANVCVPLPVPVALVVRTFLTFVVFALVVFGGMMLGSTAAQLISAVKVGDLPGNAPLEERDINELVYPLDESPSRNAHPDRGYYNWIVVPWRCPSRNAGRRECLLSR